MKVIHLEGGKQKALDLTSEEYKNYTGVKEIEDNLFDADDEDLTISTESGQRKIRLKDTPYNVNFSGLGRKILRRNIVAGKNILTQSDFANQNTVYVIKYDFDLNGGIIQIPDNCSLDFQGGKLKNGILIGFNTCVKTKSKYCIFEDIYIKRPSIIEGTTFDFSFIGIGYDWMTKDTKRDDDYLSLSNMLQFTKAIVEEKNIINIKSWVNPYYDGTTIVSKGIESRCLNFDGNGAIINILIDDYSIYRPFQQEQTDYQWGINLSPYGFINVVINNSQFDNRAKLIFKNCTIIDTKSINGFGADFNNETVSYIKDGITYTANNRGVFLYVNSSHKNVNILVENVLFTSRQGFLGGSFGANVGNNVFGRAIINNSHFYTIKNFVFEIWGTSKSIRSIVYNNCSFKGFGLLAFNSNYAVSEIEIYNNCFFHSVYGNSGTNETIPNTKYRYYNCNFINAGTVDKYSLGMSVDLEAYKCYFNTDITPLVSMNKGAYWEIFNSGKVKYFDCKFNVNSIYVFRTDSYSNVTESQDEIELKNCEFNVVTVNSGIRNIPNKLLVINCLFNNSVLGSAGNNIRLPLPKTSKKSIFYYNRGIQKNNVTIPTPIMDLSLNRAITASANENISLIIPFMSKSTNDIFIDKYMYYSDLPKTLTFSNKNPFFGNYFTLDCAVNFVKNIESSSTPFQNITFTIGSYTFRLQLFNSISLTISDGISSWIIQKDLIEGEHIYSFCISHLDTINRQEMYVFVDGNIESDTNSSGTSNFLQTINFNGSNVGDVTWITNHAKLGVKYLGIRNFSLL